MSQAIFDERAYDFDDVRLPLPAGYPRNAVSPALASSIIAKAGIAKCFGFTATSSKAGAQFILLFDSATVPANGAVPIIAFNVAAASPVSAYWGASGRSFDRGICLVNSTTQATLTVGAADCLFDVQFV